MNKQIKGIALAVCGSSLWGVSGILAQLLFQTYHASPEWLVSCRLLLAGLLILAYSAFVQRDSVFKILSNKHDCFQLLLFSVFGMLGCQYLFFKTIDLSGASLATILQFTAPIIVYGYLLLTKQKQAHLAEFLLILATFLGVFLLVTNGRFTQLNVSGQSLIFGLGSACAVAFYSLQPVKLLDKYGSPLVVGWGMFIGGVLFQFIHPISQPDFKLTGQNLLLLGLIIVFGTAVAFLAFLSCLTYIAATLATILTAIEPLLAAVLSVVVFHKSFAIVEIIGICLVIISVLLLTSTEKKQAKAAQPEEPV